jgi:hypothetical protein
VNRFRGARYTFITTNTPTTRYAIGYSARDEGGEAHKLMGRKEEALEWRDGRKRGASVALDVDSPSNSPHHSRKEYSTPRCRVFNEKTRKHSEQVVVGGRETQTAEAPKKSTGFIGRRNNSDNSDPLYGIIYCC